MGSADPNAHFRSCQVHTHIRRTVDKDLSGPIELSRSLHSDPHYSRLPARHRRRRGPRSLDPCLQRLALARRRRRFLRQSGFSRLILRIIAHHQITPCGLSLHPTLVSEVFGLICSFPLLEDFALRVFNYRGGVDGWTPLLTSPRLTGSLELSSLYKGMNPITSWLLDLPNGLNFTKIKLLCSHRTDFESITDLVSGCSNTLESLSVADGLVGVSRLVAVPDRCLTTTLSRVIHGAFV